MSTSVSELLYPSYFTLLYFTSRFVDDIMFIHNVPYGAWLIGSTLKVTHQGADSGHSVMSTINGVPNGGIKGFTPPKLPKLDLTTDAEYVANLVNVSAVYYMAMLYTYITTFFLLISCEFELLCYSALGSWTVSCLCVASICMSFNLAFR